MAVLFIDGQKKAYEEEDIRKALLDVGAAECEGLFIHSDVMFGRPGKNFKRQEYLNTIYEIINSIGVKNIIVPTFTYSFCNDEEYDVNNSKTSMGAFNEYVRKMDGRYRTKDPLLSLSVPIEWKSYFERYDGQHSLGVGGGLDAIHHMNDIKFLFLGADMAECFTYVHYVEKILDVPYRFDMQFHGIVIDEKGKRKERDQFIYTQCYGVKVPKRYDYFERELFADGTLKKKKLGDKFICCMSEKVAYREISERIKKDINYFLEEPFTKEDLIHTYSYDLSKGRITHC